MQNSANTKSRLSDHVPLKPRSMLARLGVVERLKGLADIDLGKYLQSSFEGILLVIVGIVLLAHVFGSALAAPAPLFFLVLALIVFNTFCRAIESRFKKAIECPFFPSIIVNLLLITALMYVVADSFPRLGLSLSLVYLLLSLAAATSLNLRQNIMLSALILFLLAYYLFETNSILPNLAFLFFFILLLVGLTLFPLAKASRVSQGSLKSKILASNLTEREKEIALLLAEGKANKEIAVALGISDKTVKNLLTLVYKKLDVASRQEAILRFL